MSLKPAQSRVFAILAFTLVLAAAGLVRPDVDFAAASHESGGCDVVQKMPVPSLENLREPYRKVAVSIDLRCPMRAPVAALAHLAQPYPRLGPRIRAIWTLSVPS